MTLFLVSFLTVWLTSLSKISPLDVKKNKLFSEGVDVVVLEKKTALISVISNYKEWLKGAVVFDFGMSASFHEKVAELVWTRSKLTFTYFLIVLICSVVFSCFWGLIKAVYLKKKWNQIFDFFVLFFQVTPIYVLSLFLLIIFAGHGFLGWFPLGGVHSDNFDEMSTGARILDLLKYAFLPMLAYFLYVIPESVFLMWSSSKQVLKQDFIRTAKAKGIITSKIAFNHILKSAVIPLVANLNTICLSLLTASLVIENVFNINGFGSLLFKVILERDFNTLIFMNLVIASFLLIVRFISELILHQLDPRMDLGWGNK